MDLDALFHHYGPQFFPWVVLLCAIFENDITFLMAGIYAASIHQHLSLPTAIAAGVVGALCHDTFWYGLGRNRADWLRRTKAWKRLGPQIEEWAHRFGRKQLFFSRFLPGTRNVSLVFWGVQRMPLPIFLAIEAAGLAVWGSILVNVGFWFSHQAQVWLGRVKHSHIGRWLLIALLISGVIYYGVRAYTRTQIVKHGRPPEDPRAD